MLALRHAPPNHPARVISAILIATAVVSGCGKSDDAEQKPAAAPAAVAAQAAPVATGEKVAAPVAPLPAKLEFSTPVQLTADNVLKAKQSPERTEVASQLELLKLAADARPNLQDPALEAVMFAFAPDDTPLEERKAKVQAIANEPARDAMLAVLAAMFEQSDRSAGLRALVAAKDVLPSFTIDSLVEALLLTPIKGTVYPDLSLDFHKHQFGIYAANTTVDAATLEPLLAWYTKRAVIASRTAADGLLAYTASPYDDDRSSWEMVGMRLRRMIAQVWNNLPKPAAIDELKRDEFETTEQFNARTSAARAAHQAALQAFDAKTEQNFALGFGAAANTQRWQVFGMEYDADKQEFNGKVHGPGDDAKVPFTLNAPREIAPQVKQDLESKVLIVAYAKDAGGRLVVRNLVLHGANYVSSVPMNWNTGIGLDKKSNDDFLKALAAAEVARQKRLAAEAAAAAAAAEAKRSKAQAEQGGVRGFFAQKAAVAECEERIGGVLRNAGNAKMSLIDIFYHKSSAQLGKISMRVEGQNGFGAMVTNEIACYYNDSGKFTHVGNANDSHDIYGM